MVKRATQLYNRRHKNMPFEPYVSGNKRQLKHILVQNTRIVRKDGTEDVGRLADKYYFRIFKHKGQPYTLYLGPPKRTHGGLRVKSTDKNKIRSGRRTKSVGGTSKPTVHEKTDVEKFLEQYKEIDSGPHSGKYKHKKSGDILTETQLRLALAKR